MSSVRNDLEVIVNNPGYLALFEERLKRSYNYQNIAFWLALRNLKLLVEGGLDVGADNVQERFEFISKTFMDTESAQSIALSFKAKERFRRARTQPAEEVKKAVNQAQLEVEMLLVAEVKGFLADAPTPGAVGANLKSPRTTGNAVAEDVPAPKAVTRLDRSQSEAVFRGNTTPTKSNSMVTRDVQQLPSMSPAPMQQIPPQQSQVTQQQQSTAASGGGDAGHPGNKVKDPIRSYSVSSAAPSKAAQRAVMKGSGSSRETITVPANVPPLASKVAATSANRTYLFDVGAVEGSAGRASSGESLTVFGWGENSSNQLGTTAPTGTNITSPTVLQNAVPNVGYVQCSDLYSVVVDRNGQTFCAGKLTDSAGFVPILEGHVVRQVGCGLQFLIALLDTGRLLYFGANRALEKLPLADTVVKISCGARHCVALSERRLVYSWGADEKRQLGHGVSEPVRVPRLLSAVSDVVDVACGRNSTACVSSSGVVTAWGAVTKGEVAVLEELKNKNIFRVGCSDKYVVGLSDLGRVFLWHGEAVSELGVPQVPPVVVCLRSASVFQVCCSESFLVATTDSGDVVTWGEYGSYLGQGAKSNQRRYADTPRRLPELQGAGVRRVAASDHHVLAVSGDAQSRREELVWRIYGLERQYGRALYAIAEEYQRRIKIKDAPVFDHARVLQDHHTGLLREFTRLLESSPNAASVPVGVLYSACFGSSELTQVYQGWESSTAGPLEKLARPKLAAQLAEIELEVDAVVRKSDTEAEQSRSFSLVSLIREPVGHLAALNDALTHLLSETAKDSDDYAPLLKAIGILTSLTAVAPSGSLSSAVAASPSRATNVLAQSSNNGSPNTSGAMPRVEPNEVSEQMQGALKLRALKTELDIFQEANVQLVRYALALEEELISKTQAMEGGGGTAKMSFEGCLELEEEMVAIARENAELKVRLKMMELYKQQVAQLVESGSERGSNASVNSNNNNSNNSGTGNNSPSEETSHSGERVVPINLSGKSRSALSVQNPSGSLSSSPSSLSRKFSSGVVSSNNSPILRSTLKQSATAAAVSSAEDDTPESVRIALEHEALRKRINPAAGRLLSEGEGGAARSLEQFTFDDGATAVRYNSTGNTSGAIYQGSELKAATLEKLLEHLTQSSGSLALETFLISYRNFASPQDILRRLIYMYCVAPPTKSKVVWLRLLNFLKNWVVKFWEEDWQDNSALRADLASFLSDIVQPCYPNAGATSAAVVAIETIREKLLRPSRAPERVMSQVNLAPPKPASAPALQSYKPHVVAEQLTMSEHEFFRAIKPGECFNQNWMKKTAGLSPNIVLLISRFNKLSRWAAFEVCSLSDVRDRRAMLEKLVAVASTCREVRSYGIVMAIMGALSSSAVFRLKKTWETLSRSSQTTYNELKELVSSEGNFSNLREATRLASLPCFPYVGTFLGDLTFIDAGSQDYTNNGLVNWSKFQATANTVLQLQAKQKTPYTFEVLPEWQSFLYHLPDHSENEVFELSKKNEPSK